MDDAGYLAELRPRFGDFLGAIRLAGARYGYPLALSLAERFTAERVALAGDAAHGIHPLAGQGLNLGLRDVAALAEVLVAAQRRGLDIGAADVLAGYARWRRFDTAVLAAATDGLNRAVLQRQPDAAARPRPRPRPRQPAARAAPHADPRGRRPLRRPPAAAARPGALRIPAGQVGPAALVKPPDARVAQG